VAKDRSGYTPPVCVCGEGVSKVVLGFRVMASGSDSVKVSAGFSVRVSVRG